MEKNVLNELMDMDPLEMTSENIDSIIAYHRKNRAMLEAGTKPSKPKTGTKIDLAALGLIKETPAVDPNFKRRF